MWGALGRGLGAISVKPSRSAASAAAARYLLTSDLVIEENLFICWLGGVSLEGFSVQMGETRIAANSLLVCLRAGSSRPG